MDRSVLERTVELATRTRRLTIASCPRLCEWQSIRVRWRARDGARTPSTCWPTRHQTWSGARPTSSGRPTRWCAGRLLRHVQNRPACDAPVTLRAAVPETRTSSEAARSQSAATGAILWPMKTGLKWVAVLALLVAAPSAVQPPPTAQRPRGRPVRRSAWSATAPAGEAAGRHGRHRTCR